MRIAHVITSLQTGGAETVLYRLLRHGHESASSDHGRNHTPLVISLKGKGPIGAKIEDLGISVRAMHAHERPIAAIAALHRTLDDFNSDLVHSWLYHADLLGGISARILGYPLLWGLHIESPKSPRLKWATRLVARVNALSSGWIPDHIVSCSRTAADAHVRLGYANDRMSVIPNGFELDEFRPDPERRASFREDAGIPADAPVVGKVARYHPAKDHQNFLRAAVHAQNKRPDLHFVLAGTDVVPGELLFCEYEQRLAPGTLHLLGRRDDIPRLMAALDVATLSSETEAFPMVLGEAMACGVPCVATDVGDVAYLLGDTGIVVPPAVPEALADGWLQLVEAPEKREELGRKARRRVQENFSQEAVIEQYELVYERLTCAD